MTHLTCQQYFIVDIYPLYFQLLFIYLSLFVQHIPRVGISAKIGRTPGREASVEVSIHPLKTLKHHGNIVTKDSKGMGRGV